jgi:hypothetical protein
MAGSLLGSLARLHALTLRISQELLGVRWHLG